MTSRCAVCLSATCVDSQCGEPMPTVPTEESGGTEALRDALLVHHPIMRSEDGPFSGCRCGQVGLGQDVIAHVVEHLREMTA